MLCVLHKKDQKRSGVSRESAAARLLELRVRIPSGAWMPLVSVVCCQAEVSATGRSLVQRSPTDWGVSLCVIYKPRARDGPGPRWAVAPETKKKFALWTAQKNLRHLEISRMRRPWSALGCCAREREKINSNSMCATTEFFSSANVNYLVCQVKKKRFYKLRAWIRDAVATPNLRVPQNTL